MVKRNHFVANIAATHAVVISAGTSLAPAVTYAKTAISLPQQIAPLFPPHDCQLGGAPQANRRTNRHKIRNSAARPVLPAYALAQIRRQYSENGESFANVAITSFDGHDFEEVLSQQGIKQQIC